MTILAPQSFTLEATAEAENPANITECTAPNLAQASIVTANSGIIGR